MFQPVNRIRAMATALAIAMASIPSHVMDNMRIANPTPRASGRPQRKPYRPNRAARRRMLASSASRRRGLASDARAGNKMGGWVSRNSPPRGH